MNCSDSNPAAPSATMDQAVAQLLETVRLRFYTTRPDPYQFHRDRRMLLYALTWPAVWLERRGLTCPQRRYNNLIAERLDAIRAHGDAACYKAYFPRYLLKCLQNWFEHYGDDLYGEFKHIRNALDQVLASARFAARVRDEARQLDVLVATHRLLRAQHAAQVVPDDPNQLHLF